MSQISNLECKLCDVIMRGVYEYNRHIKTTKHKKRILEINFRKEEKTNFECVKCNFKCSKKSLWEKHISTQKHQRIF